MTRIIGIDISRYEPDPDYQIWKDGQVEFAIAKSSQGDYKTDNLLFAHAEGCRKAGITFGVYHYADPITNAERQANYIIKLVQQIPDCRLIALDLEQWWSDWSEWSLAVKGKMPWAEMSRLSPTHISNNAAAVMYMLEQAFPKMRLVIYTRQSYINDYAKPCLKWIGKYPLWLARYPYAPVVIKTDWQDFAANWTPKGDIKWEDYWPAALRKWAIWQFTGEKFILPGCPENRRVKMDVNFFNGSRENFDKWLEKADVDPTPDAGMDEPENVFIPWRGVVIAWPTLNIRIAPDINARRIGSYYWKTNVNIWEEKNGWGRSDMGWIFLQYVKKFD
jgi:GH25 family lysozyme M1 (1,4-beta-N-acetylmuramidase)